MTLLGFQSVISILLRKMQGPNVAAGRELMMGQVLVPYSSSASVQDFVVHVITSLVYGTVHRVDLANCNELALHRIHRSGGSGLFGGMNELWFESQFDVPGGLFAPF